MLKLNNIKMLFLLTHYSININLLIFYIIFFFSYNYNISYKNLFLSIKTTYNKISNIKKLYLFKNMIPTKPLQKNIFFNEIKQKHKINQFKYTLLRNIIRTNILIKLKKNKKQLGNNVKFKHIKKKYIFKNIFFFKKKKFSNNVNYINNYLWKKEKNNFYFFKLIHKNNKKKFKLSLDKKFIKFLIINNKLNKNITFFKKFIKFIKETKTKIINSKIKLKQKLRRKELYAYIKKKFIKINRIYKKKIKKFEFKSNKISNIIKKIELKNYSKNPKSINYSKKLLELINPYPYKKKKQKKLNNLRRLKKLRLFIKKGKRTRIFIKKINLKSNFISNFNLEYKKFIFKKNLSLYTNFLNKKKYKKIKYKFFKKKIIFNKIFKNITKSKIINFKYIYSNLKFISISPILFLSSYKLFFNTILMYPFLILNFLNSTGSLNFLNTLTKFWKKKVVLRPDDYFHDITEHYSKVGLFIEKQTNKNVLILLNINDFNEINSFFSILVSSWIWKVKHFYYIFNKQFDLHIVIKLLFLVVKNKDIHLLMKMITIIMPKIDFKKHRKFFKFIFQMFRSFLLVLYPVFKIQGFHFEFRGKISVDGNSRTRKMYAKIQRPSPSNYSYSTKYIYKTVNTFTGVLGLKIWIYYSI